MRRIFVLGLVLCVAGIAAAAPASAGKDGPCGSPSNDSRDLGKDGSKLSVLGLTMDQRLVCFEARKPGSSSTIGTISGLAGDTTVLGIDVRPATGQLFGVGNAGGVYSIDTTTAVATKRSQLSTPLEGSSFGVDFNPVVDRLRIVSDTGQNLRANVDTGATITDAPLSGTGIAGAAYTNNDADSATATTLFDVDASQDQVSIQAPPNAGTLNPVGKLGVDTSSHLGFDAYYAQSGGTTSTVYAFASLSVGGTTRFYSVNLFPGRATSLGTFSAPDQVTGIAVPLNQG